MRNYFKYPPLQWRKRKEYCVPQGPSFAWAPWTTLHLAGNRLRFKAPRHSPHFSSVEQTRVLPGHDVLADSKLSRFSQVEMPNDHWGYATPLSRMWAFWGPWMSGCKAELAMGITVIGRQPEHAFRDISFFHPRAFEMVLVQYLNDSYGHRRWGDEGPDALIPRRHGPADWQRHSHLPVFSASCKIYNQGPDPDITNNLSYPDHLFLFPIADQYFVQVTFVQHLYSRDDRHKLTYDATPVQALQDAIFNSISLELSPESQASYNKVKAEVGDMQLTPTFAPLKWPIGVEESTAQQDSLFIER
jgi:hypothetical protein